MKGTWGKETLQNNEIMRKWECGVKGEGSEEDLDVSLGLVAGERCSLGVKSLAKIFLPDLLLW